MKLCTYSHEGATRVGVVTDDGVVDLAAAAPELPRELTALLAGGEAALHSAANATARAKSRLALDAVRLAPPLVFTKDQADSVLHVMDEALAEIGR